MIAKNQAVFMIMGDWQIGIFTAAGLKDGPPDYECAQAPTDWGKPGFILNSDSVVFFKQNDPDYVEGQKLLAHLIMSPKFQTMFNQAKGSIPARLDVDLSTGSTLASSCRRRTCRRRSRTARWCARWRTT